MKRLLLSVLMTTWVLMVSAIPAKPGLKRMLTLNDGSRVEARLVGDEHGHFWLSKDGRAFMGTSRKNIYKLIDDEQLKQLKADALERRTEANENRMARMAQRRVGDVGSSYFGKKRGLIILVNFSDVSFERTHTNALFERIANERGYSEGKFYGSMYDYFYAQSMGQFELEFDVVGPVTVSNTQSYYGRNNSQGDDMRAGAMAREACQLADSYVNYADYDWDGDGEVDQVYLVYAGKGEADGGADDTIWPHAWDLRSATGSSLQLDGVRINTYACGGELDGQTGDINGIGTMCHEFSHCLGYPDFYDTDYSGGQGMSYWDLMDSGSYNGDGYCPAGYTSYERWVAGWLEPIVLTDSMTIEGMQALQDGGNAYIMYNDGHPDEYFLLENRQHIGWDQGIPGHGLLILHVDYKASVWRANSPNNAPSHQRMTWIPADGQYESTTYYGSRYYSFDGMKSDTYPSGSNNSFGNETSPAATLYNKNLGGTTLLNKKVYDIAETNGTISFSFANENDIYDPYPITGSGDFVRVKNDLQFNEADTYVLVYESSDSTAVAFSGMKQKNSSTYGRPAKIAIDGYTIDNTDGEARELKLKAGGDGTWYVLDGDQYLTFEGTTGTLSETSAPNGKHSLWTITSEMIKCAAYGQANICLQYNPSASVNSFGCYPNNQRNLVFYVKKAPEPVVLKDPELAFPVSTVETEAGVGGFKGPELLNPNGLEVVYTSSNELLATVDAETGSVFIGDEKGEVVITATFPGDDEFFEGSASYTIVISEKIDAAVNMMDMDASQPFNSSGSVYNISGQRVSARTAGELTPTQRSSAAKGIYIVNRKKVVLK